MMSIMEASFKEQGIKYLRIDGKLSPSKKTEILHQFRTDPEISVLIMSLRMGLGLNLVEASRVYLFDPWWTPASEDQAIDRIHRLGQTRDVEVVRLLCRNTIEERVRVIQDNKRRVAIGAFGGYRAIARSEIGEKELKTLFA